MRTSGVEAMEYIAGIRDSHAEKSQGIYTDPIFGKDSPNSAPRQESDQTYGQISPAAHQAGTKPLSRNPRISSA